MNLLRLQCQHFRNIPSATLELVPSTNLIIGDNGSGKTSVLEAIYMLGLSRSFRTRHTGRIIQNEHPYLCVSGKLGEGSQVGIEKHRSGETRIRIDGENQSSAANLAKKLPIQLINPDSYRLLDAGPLKRRQFTDWGVFHVEQSYLSLWRDYQKCLKQRNAALKEKTTEKQIRIWEKVLVDSGEQINALREKTHQAFQVKFDEIIKELLPDFSISLDYFRGWAAEESMQATIDRHRVRDKILGYTQYGAHRADMRIHINKTPAVDVLSRGQQKLLVCALSVAQGSFLKEATGESCAFLIDDLASELDIHSLTRMSQLLTQMSAQVIVTGITKAALVPLTDERETAMFHVEHGNVVQSCA